MMKIRQIFCCKPGTSDQPDHMMTFDDVDEGSHLLQPLSNKGRERDIRSRNRRFRLPLLGSIRSENLLLLFTLLAVISGTAIGLHLNPMLSGAPSHLTLRQRMYLKFPGELFMRMLKMLIVPLVIASNISSIASLNARAARLLTSLSISYYIGTTLVAVFVGIAMVCIIQPGTYSNRQTGYSVKPRPVANASVGVVDSLLDLVRNMIPENLIRATFEKTSIKIASGSTAKKKTAVEYQREIERIHDFLYNLTNENFTSASLGNQAQLIEKKIEAASNGTNILGLITFSILFGFAVHSLGPDAQVLADMFHATRRVILYLVSVLIWFSPIGIMCLIAEEIAKTENLGESLEHLSLYVATVMSGLFIHGVFVLPLLLWLFTRRNPLKYACNMMQALMCALGTASSTATLPCTIRCLEGGNQIDPRVTRFMLPLGTTINMDGTALYQAIAVIFIAQLTGHNLGVGEVVVVGLTAALASMASASMPSAGMITIVMVATAVGLDDDGISLLWPVDWFLDRFRTMVNVFSDSVGAAIVSKLCENKLADEICDINDLPEPTADILEFPGGLKDVELQHDLESGTSRDATSRKHSRNAALNNGDLTCNCYQNNSAVNSQEDEGGPTCVYVVDEETIVLKF